MRTPVRGNARIIKTEPEEENGEYLESLRCFDCSVNFTSEHYLLGHLLHHIKQPAVLLHRVDRVQPAPIKLTFKSKSDNNFEIINSPTSTAGFQLSPEYLADGQISTETDNPELNTEVDSIFEEDVEEDSEQDEHDDSAEHVTAETIETQVLENISITDISFSPNYAHDGFGMSPALSEESNSNIHSPALPNDNLVGDIPGAEPTPPPESPSPTEYPKIRIKTTGLLKEPLTITEITDENPNGDYRPAEVVDISNSGDNNTDTSNFWSTPCLEDPLKLPEGDRDNSNLLSSFLNNNNDQAKAFGITTDSEFISLDRLDDRNRNALQVYNPSTSGNTANSTLDSLTGLPMQQLAEQVSRLQPSGSGMHQQNVLINIQQFPQATPQQHGYQHPPMYPPHPPHPGMPGQPPPMYQPYQYQPNPIYYPPQPNYPPGPHMQPPPPQMPPQPQQMVRPQQTMPPPQQPPQYRQPMPQRPPAPRQFNQHQQRPPAPRQPMAPRQRAPMMRPRGGMVPTGVRGPRPRMQGVNSGQGMNGVQQNNMQNHGQQRMIKRTPEQIQSLQAKKKRMDVLVPDKNDDADCQVIAVQPKNTDGGLPQIQSVQGGQSDISDNVMHLSDSITLSVRNPPPRTQSPKKSDAKVVANILATRGITVTATPKPKEKSAPVKEAAPAPSVAINLNSAVSIIPTAKSSSPTKAASESRLPTVDLTDDSAPEPVRNQQAKQAPTSPQKNNQRGAALPFRCDLCPAQYPTGAGLNKHRQSYHKTGSPCEIGIPLIDLKQPGILQKLTSLGIYNFIPLPSSTPNGNFALPVVSVNAARNSAVCNLNALGASSILTLGPVRSLPKSQTNNAPTQKQ